MTATIYKEGGKLTTLVEAQRGMTADEAYRFMQTGEVPDLSVTPQPERVPDDTQVLPLSVTLEWLGGEGGALTAAGFFPHSMWHGALLDDVTLVARFDPRQPRDSEGKWTDGLDVDIKIEMPTGQAGTKISAVSPKKITPAVIYKKHADGAVVAEADDRRMRWDAGAKKFVVERRNGGNWQETAQLTKSTAYEDAKVPGRWFESGGEDASTSTVSSESDGDVDASPETPEPAPAVVAPTVETATPTAAYTGPRFEMPENLDLALVDEFRELTKRQILEGHDMGEKLSTEESMRFYDLRYSFTDHPPAVVSRLAQEAQIDAALEVWMRNNDIAEVPTPKFKRELAKKTQEAFADKKIGVRVTPGNLAKILEDGRFKSQFESGKSKGNNDNILRANVEAKWFGLDPNVFESPEKRPIYGYVMVDGVRPAGIGGADIFAPATDALSQYGNIQVVLKDDVRSRTTAMFGDSLNNSHQGLPSPVNQPSWQSFTPAWKSMVTRGLTGTDRDVDSADFRYGNYAEAQIHDGVSVDDIEEIVFPTTPSAAVRAQLESRGVSWRVLNFKTAANSTPEERDRARRIAEQDLEVLNGQIADLEKKLIEHREKESKWGIHDTEKDIKALTAQRKKIADALPALQAKT